jgi:rsbT co-antagonist protein RsbR
LQRTNQGTQTRLPDILARNEGSILSEWLSLQTAALPGRLSATEEKQLTAQSSEFLARFRAAAQSGGLSDIGVEEWSGVRQFLTELSTSRAKAGLTPAQTAMFVFSLKEPLFNRLRQEVGEGQALADEIWTATLILDRLGLFTTEAYQKTRDEIIARQQQELMELSTPVVRLWDNVLALPLIGTLDSARTQVVMQNLLQAIVDTRSDIAIIDITGVPTVDTLVAQHLLKTVAAARLMGADCIISGIRPQIAQTIIHLGVNLEDVATKATLADAFAMALKRTGHAMVSTKPGER